MGDDLLALPLEGDEREAALRNANACHQMAELCGELLDLAPHLTPREFLRTLGALVAGIDLGVKGFRQLARGGANGLVGAGFRAEYDDGTAGQRRRGPRDLDPDLPGRPRGHFDRDKINRRACVRGPKITESGMRRSDGT